MGIGYDIVYHKLVVKEDIPKLSVKDKERVRVAITEKLSTRPEVFGVPLRRHLKGYRKLRVGDYRVIFRIERKVVKIFYIRHRSIAYKLALRRVL
jgi:mRNA interferase RelE/StbE